MNAATALLAALLVSAAWPALASEDGRELFRTRCAVCHGEGGAGDGPAARFLTPRPRDLTRENLKSSGHAEGPAEGLRLVLRRGMPGSSMPRFTALSEEQLDALVGHVLALRPPEEEAASTFAPSSAQRGRAVFQAMGCTQCHGSTGAGDGPSAPTLVDGQGRSISPRDLRRPRSFRFGADRAALLATFRHGLPGTPMPAFGDAISPAQADDLISFLRQISLQEFSPPD